MKFDLEDMRKFAERHRNRVYQSGPHWSTLARFTLLFDECEKVMLENLELKCEISRLMNNNKDSRKSNSRQELDEWSKK